ncbi:MAG: alpha/beta hydrolase [Steroidobacteraceae bacterium]
MTSIDGAAPERDGWRKQILAQAGESRFLSVNGGRIHYLVRGEDRANRGTVLLVHGFRGHAHWWDAIAPFLATDFRVLAIDLSGMGDSDHRAAYELPTFADDITGLIEHECSQPVTIIGHSFGGSRCLQACALRPELFTHAIVCDSFFWLSDERRTEPAVKGTRTYASLEEAMARFRLLPDQPVWSRELFQHVGRHSLKQVEGGWAWKFDPTLAALTYHMHDEDVLARVRAPVHFVYGERSRIVDADRAQRTLQRLSQGKGPIVIPDAHHHLMLDRPLALVSALRALLV